MCHAEVNAILNKNSSDVKNCTIYVGLFPCNECAKVIIQSGIKLVIYMSDKHAHKLETVAAKRMFDAAGVAYRYFSCTDQLYKCQNAFVWTTRLELGHLTFFPYRNQSIKIKIA